MSAESSPALGEMPEWVQRNVEWARTWPREHKGSPVIDTIATITWLADALSTVQERAERAERERDEARDDLHRTAEKLDEVAFDLDEHMLRASHFAERLNILARSIRVSTPIPEGADRAE